MDVVDNFQHLEIKLFFFHLYFLLLLKLHCFALSI